MGAFNIAKRLPLQSRRIIYTKRLPLLARGAVGVSRLRGSFAQNTPASVITGLTTASNASIGIFSRTSFSLHKIAFFPL